jgi:voltage-gated potassium channel
MRQGALPNLAQYTAPLRRFGAWLPARYLVVAVGLIAMTAYTVSELRGAGGFWLRVCLWCCLGFFATDGALRLQAAWAAGTAREHAFSLSSGFVNLLGVAPVPIALACGVAQESAWLFGSFWVLKLGQDLPGFAQLERVFVLEAKPLASVLALFLIVLFLASAAMHVIERDGQPAAFGTLPAALWWAVVTLTANGYGDEVPKTELGHLISAVVMICGIATFGLWTGILATGFANESRRRNFIETWDLVSKVPSFQMLDPTAITEITHMLRWVEVPERTAVIRRGDIGDCMYFIAAGEVEVDIEPTPVRLGVGAFFGELALLSDSIRTANVTTTKPSTLLILDLADFRKLMAHYAELAHVINAEGKRRQSERLRPREARSRAEPS